MNDLSSLAVFAADTTKPLMDRVRLMHQTSADALPHPHLISAIFPILTCVCICGLVTAGLAKQVIKATSAASEKKFCFAAERQKRMEGFSKFELKVEAARLWHGEVNT